MKFNHQKRGTKYLKGFKDAVEECLIQLKQNQDEPIENIIKGFECALKFLEEKIK